MPRADWQPYSQQLATAGCCFPFGLGFAPFSVIKSWFTSRLTMENHELCPCGFVIIVCSQASRPTLWSVDKSLSCAEAVRTTQHYNLIVLLH